MFIEHIGISVKKPFEMADWYAKNLGCKVLYKFHKDKNSSTVFITDDSCKTVLEILNEPGVEPVCNLLNDSSQLHFAFISESPKKDCERLIKVGATFMGEIKGVPGSLLLSLCDPWGNAIQLVKREKALL